jgi:hypothetical protein
VDVVDDARQRHQPWIDRHAVEEHVEVGVELVVAEHLVGPIVGGAHGVAPSWSSMRASAA